MKFRDFLLFVRPETDELPLQQKVNLLVLYAVALASLGAAPFNMAVDLAVGAVGSVVMVGIYLGLTLSSVLVFWASRSLKKARRVMAFGVFLLSTYLIIQGGGAGYGLGFFYFITAFSLLYFILGFKSGIFFSIYFFVGVVIRTYLGDLPAGSLFSVPDLRDRFILIFGVATAFGIIAVFYQHNLVRSISRIAYFDSVTGLSNRERMGEILDLSIRAGRPFTLGALKLHRFGRVSSYQGAAVGDSLLGALGRRMKELLPPRAIAGRWSGTLFLILHEDDPSSGVEAWGKELLSAVQEPLEVGSRKVGLKAGMAVTRFPADGMTADRLVANLASVLDSDQFALGKIRYFNETAWQAEQRRLKVASALEGAMDRGELSLVFQPKVHLDSGKFQGAEALLRWNNQELGPVSPAEFIPLAEAGGQIHQITQFVALRVFEDWSRVLRHCRKDCRPVVALNLAADDLGDLDFPGFLKAKCDRLGIPCSQVELEITEGSMMADDPRVKMVLSQLKGSGFRLAIDDFGTGYSSLSYLQKLDADTLKIDQSFIRGIDDKYAVSQGAGGQTSPIVDAVLFMGHSLGMEITAEGVETEVQAAYLRARGCELAQGWLFARPMPIEELLDWITARK